MIKIANFLAITAFVGLFINCVGEEIKNVQENLHKFNCLNCKLEYRYNEEVKFEIVYAGNTKIGVKFGIKVKIGEKWMLLVEDIGSAVPDIDPVSKKQCFRKLEDNSYSGHSIWMFKQNQKREVLWNKQVSLSIEMFEKNKHVMNPLKDEDGELVPYNINRGGKLKLFVYSGAPYLSTQDPQMDLFEFDFIGVKE